MSRRVGSHVWYPALVCVLAILSACVATPDLRLRSDEGTPVSIAAGKRLLEEGRAVETVAAFRAALRKDGGNVAGLNGLAIAYGELGKPERAAEMFARALALEPDDPATLNNIGFAALRRADVELARHYLERAGAGTGDLAEIDGNLKGLALLEEAERERASRRASWQAAFFSDEPDQAPRIRLSIAGPASSAKPSSRPLPIEPAAMLIDFAAVNDPFSDPLTAE